ncbi:hypothetical protein Q8A67_024193 [Cirrhinus molitorella]|uniref:Uncharacterized protein n=1 Tax=Cirrhinus molitorella TaxID=172907 RepID=A0AA88P3R5_9TELE|nr:hypothetical protein Q8A67_024193 [Cirrhinus molitorella]
MSPRVSQGVSILSSDFAFTTPTQKKTVHGANGSPRGKGQAPFGGNVVSPAVARDNGLFTLVKPKTDVSGIPGLLTLRSNGPAGAVGAPLPNSS